MLAVYPRQPRPLSANESALLVTATIGGCTERDEQSLADGDLEVSVAAGFNDAHVVSVYVSRFEATPSFVSDTSNCVTLPAAGA